MGRNSATALALVILLAACATAHARVLLVHDTRPSPGLPETAPVRMVRDLLGHFDPHVDAIPSVVYQQGELNAYDAVVYLGLWEGVQLPDAFLQDCYDTDRAVCWLGANLSQLARRFSLGRFGFRVEAEASGLSPRRIVYEGRPYWRAELPLPHISITDRDVCQPVALAEAGDERLPYGVRCGSFWYFPEIPLGSARQGGVYLILCDILHDVLGSRHAERRTALICLTGITPDTDASGLWERVKGLDAERVPFAICMTPVGPEFGDRLSRNRALVGALRRAQRGGAAVIARPRTGAEPDEAAVAGPSVDAMEETLAELAVCGLYPVGWALDRSRLRDPERAELSAFCSTIWDIRSAAEQSDLPPMPLLILSDARGQRVLPDNLPRLTSGGGEVEEILDTTRRSAALPDPWVTVGIAPTASGESVRMLLAGLRDVGYRFADLRRMPAETTGERLHVQTVATSAALPDLLPDGWDASLLSPEVPARRFEHPERDGRESATVSPGMILLSYPHGQRPRTIFALQGPLDNLTDHLVRLVASALTAFAVAAAAVLLVLYVAQLARVRRA